VPVALPSHGPARILLTVGLVLGLAACGSDEAAPDLTVPDAPEGCPDNRWPPCPEGEDLRARGNWVGSVLPSLVGVDQFGDDVDLLQFRGATAVLSFGATWCAPCRSDAANYEATRDYVAGDAAGPVWMIEFLDDARDVERGLHADWAEAYGIDEPVLGGPAMSSAAFAMGISGFPTKVVVDYDGRIVGRLSGSGQWDVIRTWVLEAERRRLDAENADAS